MNVQASKHILFGLVASLITINSHAAPFSLTNWIPDIGAIYPIISIGGGGAFGSNINTSQTIPIRNPITDEFYRYHGNNNSNSTGLFDFFLGEEIFFCNNWLLQLGVDYNYQSPFRVHGTFVQGADDLSADTYSYHYKVSTYQFLGVAKVLYTFRHIFHPYGLVGLGASFNRAYDYTTNVPPFLTFTRAYANKRLSEFSYSLGFGVDVDVIKHIRVGAGYRFSDLGRLKFGQSSIDNTPVYGTLSESNPYFNEVFGQVTILMN